MNKLHARVFLLALLLCGAAHAEVAVPPLTHRVTDLTSTLDAQQTQTLEARLAEFEAKKGAQIAVLIVPTTAPETIEQFGIRVVEAWKLGRKGVDDGALLLVAKDDRTLRIEVGYGLEGVLNDATANRIIDEIIVPRFKRGDIFSGIESGTAAMMQVVNGEPLPPPRRAAASGKFDIESMLFVAFGLVVVVGGMLRAMLGRFPAAVLMGGALGVLAWLTVAPLLVAVLAGSAAMAGLVEVAAVASAVEEVSAAVVVASAAVVHPGDGDEFKTHHATFIDGPCGGAARFPIARDE